MPDGKVCDVDLSYISNCGKWYAISLKGDIHRSSWVSTNFGINFFDILGWTIGELKGVVVEVNKHEKAGGKLYFQKAYVKRLLRIHKNDLLKEALSTHKKINREINIKSQKLKFSEGFADLQTINNQDIINREGIGIKDAQNSIEVVSQLRNL